MSIVNCTNADNLVDQSCFFWIQSQIRMLRLFRNKTTVGIMVIKGYNKV